MAIKGPNYTQIPNEILDRMHEMTPAEVVVLMAICRLTFGWHKAEDVISLSQLQRMTGLSRSAVQSCLMAGMERRLLERRQVGTQSFSYHLLVASDYQSTETTSSDGGPVQEPTSSPTLPVPVASDYQQLVVSDYSQKKGLKKLKETTTIPPPLRLMPGGGGGGGDVFNTVENAGEVVEVDDDVDGCEIESDQTRRAELVDQLVALGVWRSKAVQAVAAGTVASEHDIVCCKRFLASSTAAQPASVLWSEWLSAGNVPPIPRSDTSTVTQAQIAAAARMREESERRNAHADQLVVLPAARRVVQGGHLRPMPPAGPPASFWRTSP